MHFEAKVAEHDKINPRHWLVLRVRCTPAHAASTLRTIRGIIQANTPSVDIQPIGKRCLNLKTHRFNSVPDNPVDPRAMSLFLANNHHASVTRTGANTYQSTQAAKNERN